MYSAPSWRETSAASLSYHQKGVLVSAPPVVELHPFRQGAAEEGYQPEQPVISHMNLTIAPGEKVALVGLNGAGKTTLVKLLCGLYAPQSGRILLHGRDLRSFGAEELAERFAVVFQDIHLLPATIERNITLSDRADPLRLRSR